MDDVGVIMGWPLRDPRWPGRLLLTGLLWLLLSLTLVGAPIAAMALNGWMLTALDNLRAGRRELPPPGFSNFRRGARLFLAFLVYLLTVVVVGGIPQLAGYALGLRGNLSIPAGLLVIFGQSITLVGTTAVTALTPGIVLQTEAGGLAGGLDVRRLLRSARAGGGVTVLAGLLALLSLDIISPVGALFCVVGLALTTPYAFAVLAAAVHGYERALASDSTER